MSTRPFQIAAVVVVGAGVALAITATQHAPASPAVQRISLAPTSASITPNYQPVSPTPTDSPTNLPIIPTPNAAPITLAGPVDEAGWTTTLPVGFAPVMPAATAELATQLTPALSSLHLSPLVPTEYWSEAECDWLSDTMYADVELDSAAASRDYAALDISLGWWYSNVVDEWRFLEGIATQACWRGGSITGEQASTAIKDAMGDGWNGHPAHLAQDAPGSFDVTWDTQWTDAYQEIAVLFAQVPQAPYYFCLDSGWGQAYASTCTPASILTTLGVASS